MGLIGDNIHTRRKALGWSTDYLGKLAGYTNGTMIQQIERGPKEPSTEKLRDIARALGVTASDLVGDAQPCGITNNANGTHAIGYQHMGGCIRMTDELREGIRAIVTEVVDARCEQLLEEMQRRFPGLAERPGEDETAPGEA